MTSNLSHEILQHYPDIPRFRLPDSLLLDLSSWRKLGTLALSFWSGFVFLSSPETEDVMNKSRVRRLTGLGLKSRLQPMTHDRPGPQHGLKHKSVDDFAPQTTSVTNNDVHVLPFSRHTHRPYLCTSKIWRRGKSARTGSGLPESWERTRACTVLSGDNRPSALLQAAADSSPVS